MQVTCINNQRVKDRCFVLSWGGSMSRLTLLLVLGFALGVGCGDSDTQPETEDGEASTTIDSTNSGTGTSTESPSSDDTSNETAAETVRLLPLSCFIGSSACDPRNGDGCDDGATCDFSSESQLTCFPPPNTAQIDTACNNSGGPFCASGGWCAPDNVTGEALCHKVCCDDSDCSTPGTKCTGIFTDPNIGSLGLCRFPTEDEEENNDDASNCLPPGASCSPSDDQCCGYCHVGHCH